TLESARCQAKSAGKVRPIRPSRWPEERRLSRRCPERPRIRERPRESDRRTASIQGKSEPDDKRAPRGRTAFEAMQSRVGQQRLDLKYAGQVKTEENNDHTGDAGEQRFVLREDLADFRRDRTERDEDDAEADDEGSGIEHHLAEELPFLQLQLLDAYSRDQGNVPGDERKHAGR